MSDKKRRVANVTRVEQMEEVVPATNPVEALRRNLLYQMFKAIDGQAMFDIMQALRQKALDGDVKAINTLIKFIQASGGERSAVYMQQAVVNQGERRFLSDIRREIVYLLASNGPMTAADICKTVHTALPQTLQALNDHAWFEKDGSKWTITTLARAEVLTEME